MEVIEESVTGLPMKTFPGAAGIFHQAAIPSVPRSVKDPLASNEANVAGVARRGEGLRGAGRGRRFLLGLATPPTPGSSPPRHSTLIV